MLGKLELDPVLVFDVLELETRGIDKNVSK